MKFLRKGKISTLIFSALIPFFLIVIIIFFHFDFVMALRKMNERDYITEQWERFHGTGPTIGVTRWISLVDSRFPHQVTYTMKKYRTLLIRIESDIKHSGVIMLASQPASPRMLKTVWSCEDLRYPISFWTDRYWRTNKKCNETGCPKIRFQVTKGALAVGILDGRK